MENAFFDAGEARQSKDRSGRGAYRFWVVRIHGAFEKHCAARSESFGGTKYRAGVARFLNTVEHHDEGASTKSLVQRPGGWFDQRDHALRRFGGGNLLKYQIRHGENANSLQPVDVSGDSASDCFSGNYSMDAALAAEGFFEKMEAFGNGESVVGEAAANDGAADNFEKWILRTGDGL